MNFFEQMGLTALALLADYGAIVILALIFSYMLRVAARVLRWRSNRKWQKELDKLNEEHRQNRLQETEWNGLPYPNTSPAKIVITMEQVRDIPWTNSRLLAKAYAQRADDLGAAITFYHEPNGNIMIVWEKKRSRK